MRPDRDEYVKVVSKNVEPPMLGNFRKYGEEYVDMLGLPYDYDSIMHYGPTDFAKKEGILDQIIRRVTFQPEPGLVTLKTMKPYAGEIGQRDHLSALDIKKLNRAYKCGGGASLEAQPNWAPAPGNDDGEFEEYYI